MKFEDWGIDKSCGRDVLVYKNCSVIEGEDAWQVLDILRSALCRAGYVTPASVNGGTATTCIRKQLYSFYTAYNRWLKNRAMETGDDVFTRAAGLCANAYDYFESTGADSEAALEQLHADFISAGLNEKLPFNRDSKHYRNESKLARCHLNSARVAWVEKHCISSDSEITGKKTVGENSYSWLGTFTTVKQECPTCGNENPEYLKECPHCGGQKCNHCDMGDDTACMNCEGE